MMRAKQFLLLLVVMAGTQACLVAESPYEPVYIGCWADVDCPYDMYCTNSGYCHYVSGCYSDAACPAGYVCALDGSCILYAQCSYDWECQDQVGYGYVCVQGACTVAPACITDYECPYGYQCSAAGYCLELVAGLCTYDSDCYESCETSLDCPGVTSVCNINGLCSNSLAYYCGADRACHFSDSGCFSDFDCPYGFYCSAGGFCKDSLCFITGCPSGFMCATDGNCYAASGTFDQCEGDDDCLNNFYCDDFDGFCYSAGCKSHSQCPAGYFCGYDSYCWPLSECVEDNDCSFNQACIDGTCLEVFVCISNDDCPWGAYCSDSGLCYAY